MRRLILGALVFLGSVPGFASTLRLVMFDGFSDCRHGVIEEQVIKNFASGVEFQVTEYSITHGVNCDQLDMNALITHLKEATQLAKTDRLVVYFGYAVYGRLQNLNKLFGDLAKLSTIVVGAGNIANDSCTQNWLAPYAVLVGSARDGAIESYSGRGACTDLYLDYGGSLTVVIDGVYYGIGGTSTSSAIVAGRALSLWAANPQVPSAQINQALSLGQRILKTAELMVPPRVVLSASHQPRLVSVSGKAVGPVPSVAIYRGLPSNGSCKGKPVSTVAVRQDGSFTLATPAKGVNVCIQPKPLGQA